MRSTLRNLLLLAAALGLGVPAVQAAPLVEPEALAAKIANPAVRVVDIRDGRDDTGRTPYEAGHLPGAVSAPYSQWRGPRDNPGKLPDAARITQLIQSLGLERDTETVIAHEGRDATDFGSAARVYWTLKAAGLTNLSILNGGVRAWVAAGKPLSTVAVSVKPSGYTAKLDPNLIATRAELEAAIASQKATLIDARPPEFYQGDTRHLAAKVPGTIRGAKNVSHATWFGKDSAALLPVPEIRKAALANGIDPAKASGTTVSFCNTGHWAATNWFVLSEVLGEPNVKLYPESMVEWSASGGPMDNVPNRLKQLLIELQLALQ